MKRKDGSWRLTAGINERTTRYFRPYCRVDGSGGWRWTATREIWQFDFHTRGKKNSLFYGRGELKKLRGCQNEILNKMLVRNVLVKCSL
jgi:hypothetical protein